MQQKHNIQMRAPVQSPWSILKRRWRAGRECRWLRSGRHLHRRRPDNGQKPDAAGARKETRKKKSSVAGALRHSSPSKGSDVKHDHLSAKFRFYFGQRSHDGISRLQLRGRIRGLQCNHPHPRGPAPRQRPPGYLQIPGSQPAAKPSNAAPFRYGSGEGLPWTTSSAVTICAGMGRPA